MQESGAAGRYPRADWFALFEGEFAADLITRPNRVRGFKEGKT